MVLPLYKKLKNGTTLYVFPSVQEDANFQSQNENYQMRLSHFVLVNFPRQILGNSTSKGILDFGKAGNPDATFDENSTSIRPTAFKDQLVESLSNYVANQETVIRNSKINASTYYYDTFEPATTTEKIFWKWAKSVGIIDFETADPVQEYSGANTKYNNNGPNGNTNHYREYLWKERSTTIYDVSSITLDAVGTTIPAVLPVVTVGKRFCTIQLTSPTKLEPGDSILINKTGIDNVIPNTGYSDSQSLLKVVGIGTNNDTIIVEIDGTINSITTAFGTPTDRELYNAYSRFVQFISEIGGLNNVQLPDKSYSETFAYISHQHGQIPYTLWNIKNDNNYKPNSQFPILASEIQAEVQGGENPNNPLLINPSLYPGDIWGQFDTPAFLYTTKTGDILKRSGEYYGITGNPSNTSPSLLYPDFDGSLIDGLCLNLNINDYAEAVSYVYNIETFNEFCATSFNNIAPKDFEYNAILWYYTIEDVTGNTIKSATNLYGVEFLDTPDNDVLPVKTKIPSIKKLVSNGYQDGSSYTFTLDTNIAIDSDTQAPSFDPDKVYSLFGMELFYEALTRITYFNDQITNYMNSNLLLNQKVDDLTGLVYNQQSLESIRSRMNNLELLLNVYSTLQIGISDTIIPRLDTTVNPPLLRLDSVDKQYGYVYQVDTKSMFNEFINVNSLTDITIVKKTINVVNGKDFLIMIGNNDNSVPSPAYDTSKALDILQLIINKDLDFKQKIDIIIYPKVNINNIVVNEPINDKKINISINYNDGQNIIPYSLGIFNLPVLKYVDSLNYKDEFSTNLTYVPVWKIRDIYYSAVTATTNRIFSLIIEDDLTQLPKESRIYIDNLFLENNPGAPTGTYKNLSGQYKVYNTPVEQRSNIIDVLIENIGTGCTIGFYSFTITDASGTLITIIVNITSVNGTGGITGIELISVDKLTKQSLLTNTYILPLFNNDVVLKFVVKTVTKIDMVMVNTDTTELNTFLNAYDAALNISIKPNIPVNLKNYIKINPSLTLLRGFKISMIRISDTNLPVTLIEQRYNIKIDKI